MVKTTRSGARKAKKAKEESSRIEEPVMPYEDMRPFDEKEEGKESGHFRERRQNVGARNPYVIAIRVLAEKGMDVSSCTPQDLPKLMKKAFEGYHYDELFDPRYGSPVYYGIYYATLRLAQVCPKLYDEALSYLRKDPARRTGEKPWFCDPAVPGHLHKTTNMYTTIHGHGFNYRDKTVGKDNNGLEFHNPIQGCIADCWLISALSSVAWAEYSYPKFPKKLYRQAATPPIIGLYPPSTPSTRKYITTSMEFYLDTTLGKPYYACSDEDDSVLGFYESWPCYYEKCFASYWQQNRVPSPPSSPNFLTINNPNYSLLNYKDSFGATEELTGKTVNSTDTATYLPDLDEDIIDDIYFGACDTQDNRGPGVFIETIKPVTAYTYLTAAYAAVANDIARYGAGSNVIYDMPGLPANHAFSLLGVYQEAGINYVVLRNPWGYAGDSASFNAYAQGHLAQNLPRVCSDTVCSDIAQVDQGINGIFGLDSLCFMRYFESFGWTK